MGSWTSSSHKKGHPKKMFKDNLKSYIKWAEIQPKQFESSASDSPNWQALVRKTSTNFKEDHCHCLAVPHDCRHRASSASILAAGILCSTFHIYIYYIYIVHLEYCYIFKCCFTILHFPAQATFSYCHSTFLEGEPYPPRSTPWGAYRSAISYLIFVWPFNAALIHTFTHCW